MSQVRLILLSGFLGAGKATTIARLAEAYRRQKLNVGIIANGQAADSAHGPSPGAGRIDAGQAAGWSFVSDFDDFANVLGQLEPHQRPDVVLANLGCPCVDIVATVVRPLRQEYQDEFALAPSGVVLKPSHVRKVLGDEPYAGRSPEAARIFKDQLARADILLLNRIDELPPEDVDELAALIGTACPGVPLVRVSAKTGAGFDALLELLDQPGNFGCKLMEGEESG